MKIKDLIDKQEEERDKEIQEALNLLAAEKPKPIVKTKSPSRNDLCPCGSGKKYKNCCMNVMNSILEKWN